MNLRIRIIFVFFTFTAALGARAAAGRLTKPSLSFPTDFPAAARTNISAILSRAEYGFLGGDFVNASTQLRYGGDTEALNRFMRELAACADVTLAISFVTNIEEEQGAAWRVVHSAHSDRGRLDVQVNFHSKKINLEDLQIPEIKSHGS